MVLVISLSKLKSFCHFSKTVLPSIVTNYGTFPHTLICNIFWSISKQAPSLPREVGDLRDLHLWDADSLLPAAPSECHLGLVRRGQIQEGSKKDKTLLTAFPYSFATILLMHFHTVLSWSFETNPQRKCILQAFRATVLTVLISHLNKNFTNKP